MSMLLVFVDSRSNGITTSSYNGLHTHVQEEEEDEEAQLRGLKGLKVKHTADELQEGETMILTLADKNILHDKGDLDDEEQDELENVLAVSSAIPRVLLFTACLLLPALIAF